MTTATEIRQSYGATARGHSAAVGWDTWRCARRSDADRIRRVVRAWDAAGGWCGPRTLDRVVSYAMSPAHRRESVALVIERCQHQHTRDRYAEDSALLATLLAERDARAALERANG